MGTYIHRVLVFDGYLYSRLYGIIMKLTQRPSREITLYSIVLAPDYGYCRSQAVSVNVHIAFCTVTDKLATLNTVISYSIVTAQNIGYNCCVHVGIL